MVICNNKTNWPEQVVLTDPMDKGRIPLGVFELIEFGHQAWLGEHKLEHAQLSCIATACFAHHMREVALAYGPTLRSHTRAAQGSSDDTEEQPPETDSDTASSQDIGDDVPVHEDETEPIDENDFEDGVRRDKQ